MVNPPPRSQPEEKKTFPENLVTTLTKATTDFMIDIKANFQNQQLIL